MSEECMFEVVKSRWTSWRVDVFIYEIRIPYREKVEETEAPEHSRAHSCNYNHLIWQKLLLAQRKCMVRLAVTKDEFISYPAPNAQTSHAHMNPS